MSIRNHVHKFFDFSIRCDIPHIACPFSWILATSSLLITTYFRWTVSGAGDSSFIHLKLVFPYGLRFVCGGFFGMTCHFYEGGKKRRFASGDINLKFDIGESPLLPPLSQTESVIPN